MADNPLTLEKMLRGSQNLDVWETATNGDVNTDWTNLVGDKGPSLKKAIKLIMQKAPINSAPFGTKASLLADTTLADNAFAFIYDDVAELNGLYQKINGSWVKQKYNIYELIDKLGFVHINIIDPSKVINGKYVNYQSGLVWDLAGYSAAGAYPVKPNTEYQISNWYREQFAFYDDNMQFVSGIAEVDQTTFKFTTPANARYIKLTVPTDKINTLVLSESSLWQGDAVKYGKIINPLLNVNSSQVTDLIDTVTKNLGFTYRNIINPSKVINGKYVNYQSGLVWDLAGYSAAGAYPVKPNTEYQISSWYKEQFAFYDDKMQFISGLPIVDQTTYKFTTPFDARYIKLSIPTAKVNDLVLAESDKWTGDTAKFGLTIDNLVYADKQYTEIFVSADLNDTDALVKFKGNNAIQQAIDSITDASAINRYRIVVKKGLYKITQANEFLGYRGYPAMVCPKDFVDIVGQGKDKTIVWAELPHDDAQIGVSVDGNTYPRDKYQTIYNYAVDMTISDITFVGKNLRYTLHQDSGVAVNGSRQYKNVDFIFKGDKGYLTSMGNGTFSGEHTTVTNGKSFSDKYQAFSTHNNVNFKKPSGWTFNNYEFGSVLEKGGIILQNDGSLVQDTFEINGCSMTGASYILRYYDYWINDTKTTFNHAEWCVTGSNNQPFLFDNTISGGVSLVFKTTGTGADKTIRFDKTSSAYPILIKAENGEFGNALYTSSRKIVDEYIAQDGSVDLPAIAWGCVDVYGGAYPYTNADTTRLAKRLGNLTSSNKQLVIVANGVSQTITFNKDYSAMSNEQVLAEINAQLTDAVASTEVYGRYYYPMMTDVTASASTASATFIPKGSIVTKQGLFVKLANANDKIFGVALDDIPVVKTLSDGEIVGDGRVLKRGYISADKSKAHFVLADNQNPSIGTRFAVSNGQLVTDSNGKISVDIDNGIVSINC